MDIVFERKTLLGALGALKPAVQKNALLETLQYVHVRAEGGQAEWTATDLGLAMQLPVAAEVAREGEVCVHYETLADVVSKVQDETVRLSLTEDGQCAVTGASFECTVATHPVEAFPAVLFGADETHPEMTRLILLREGIGRIRRAVTPFASGDDARPGLTGLHWMLRALYQDTAPHLYVEAADGFRLAQLRLVDFEATGNANALDHLLSPRFVAQLERADADEVTLWFYPEMKDGQVQREGYVVAQVGKLWVRDSLMDGNFPDTAPFLDDKPKALGVMFEVDSLRRALQLAAVYSNAVQFEADPDASRTTLKALDSARGKCVKSLPATVTTTVALEPGEMFKFGLGARFLMDVLNAVRGEQLTLEMDTPTSPCRLSERNFKAVIMPLTTGTDTAAAPTQTPEEEDTFGRSESANGANPEPTDAEAAGVIPAGDMRDVPATFEGSESLPEEVHAQSAHTTSDAAEPTPADAENARKRGRRAGRRGTRAAAAATAE